ncbi:MAG: hypothetical protein BWK79_15265 [Beggiatoa sp. IS2]|nr:MAG: hypothetical protein BWK79_15265 [Beggiatoa sp. IS2]
MTFQSDKPLFTDTTSNQETSDLFADFKPFQQHSDQDFFAEPASAKTTLAEDPEALMTEKKSVDSIKFSTEKWKTLVVDDETDIHKITTLALRNYVYKNKPLELISAYSAAQAKTLLEQHPDIALIFLDVVMESHDAGLQLVRYIRDDLKNPWVRIILRTGQPGHAPEKQIIINYEINDYVSKTELTHQKLLTLTTASLRSYADLMTVELYRQNLEEKVNQRTQELTLLNEQLVSLNKEKDEFLSIAAHDLKNPLAAILGLAEEISIYFDHHGKEKIVEYTSIIQTSAKQMFSLIANLLDVNKIESGKVNISFQSIDLFLLVQQVLNTHRERAIAKQLQLHYQSPTLPCIGLLDSNVTRQILDNLISNAIKYSPPGKNIYVRLAQTEQTVRCEIQDEGPGLNKRDQQKLFGKFARLTAQPTAQEHSTGLGLFIVKKLVIAMNGRVWCESEWHKGATFIVEFSRVP